MITIETLKGFCGDWPEWIATPWSQNGWTYATEGHVILQVPAIPGVEEKDIKQIKALPWEELGKPVKWRLRPEQIAAVRERFRCQWCETFPGGMCDECGGTRWNTVAGLWQLEKDYFVAPHLLQKITDALGVLELVEPRKGTEAKLWPPVGFRFDGGGGLLMPMNPLGGAVVVNKEIRQD